MAKQVALGKPQSEANNAVFNAFSIDTTLVAASVCM